MELEKIFALSQQDQLKALQLYVQKLVSALPTGGHKSTRKGSGIEFKEYKNYVPGDNIRQLDWKYYARTDHYMIKEAEVEKLEEFVFVLDRSASMRFASAELSKLNYAKVLIAALSFLAENQHDQYSIFGNSFEKYTYQQFLQQLIQINTNSQFNHEELYPTAIAPFKSTIFILTDAYFDAEILEETLRKWSIAANKVVLIHMLFKIERDLAYQQEQFRFQDLETGKTIEVNAPDQRKDYQLKMANWISNTQALCRQYQIIYHPFDAQQTVLHHIFRLTEKLRAPF